jgi:translation initiation factor IF-3
MILNRLAEDLGELAVVEQRPQQDGRNMTMMLGPAKTAVPEKPEKAEKAEKAEKPAAAASETPAAAASEEPAAAASEEPAAAE